LAEQFCTKKLEKKKMWASSGIKKNIFVMSLDSQMACLGRFMEENRTDRAKYFIDPKQTVHPVPQD
jgi:hypothetical protein